MQDEKSTPGTAAGALDRSKLQWFRRQLSHWARHHCRDFPWRRTQDPYSIFVAEFLLQKTNATTVAPIYQTFISRYPTVGDLAAAPLPEVSALLVPLGLSFRAQRLHRSAQIVSQEYGAKIPGTEAELLRLPGVGPYTARAVCANAFNQPKPVLDTNVARILERFFGLDGGRIKFRSPALKQAAELAAPKKQVGTWNLGLLDFAAGVCTARNPRCSQCPLQAQCTYGSKVDR